MRSEWQRERWVLGRERLKRSDWREDDGHHGHRKRRKGGSALTRREMKLREGGRTPVWTERESSAEGWVAHSLINTAARFLLRPLAGSVLLLLLYIHL